MTSPMPLDPEVAEVLRRIRDEILTGPERWHQGPVALNASGSGVNAGDGEARSWCLFGAVLKALDYRLSDHVAHGAEAALWSALPDGEAGYIGWNERPGRTYADVRSLLDRALGEGA
jgi:hypothetical protein